MRSTWLFPAALAVSLLWLAACSREPAEGPGGLLALVPADTPYVFVADRPLPEGLRGRLADHYAAQLAGQADAFARLREQLEGSAEMAPMAGTAQGFLDVIEALFAELQGRDNAAALRELGIEPVARSVVYGIGLLPAMRIEIADGAALEALLDRVEQRAGVRATRAVHEGQAYRRIDLGAVDAVVAVGAGFAVAGLLPDTLFERDLPLLLGQRPPASDLAASGTVAEMVQRHGFSGYGEGFVRLDQVVAALLGRGAGRDGEVMQALGAVAAPLPAACLQLVDHLVAGMPRLALGVTRADERQLATRAIWESTPAVAAHLRGLAAPVPGVGGAYDGLVAVGLGLNLPQLRNALEALLREVADRGAGCEWVDGERLQAMIPQLNLALGPLTAGIRGFNLHLDDLELDPATLAPQGLRGGLLAAVDDPRGLFALGAMFDPALAALEIPTDGTPVELPQPAVADPATPPLRVAMKDKALVLLAGDDPAATLAPLLGAAAVSPPPLFAVDYGVSRLVERLAGPLDGLAGQLAARGEPVAAGELREQLAAFRLEARLFERVRVSLYAGEQGLVMDQEMVLR